jgi:hypothetical protein
MLTQPANIASSKTKKQPKTTCSKMAEQVLLFFLFFQSLNQQKIKQRKTLNPP